VRPLPTLSACALALALASGSVRGEDRAHEQVRVQVLGLNDFHGQLTPGKQLQGRSVGGAAVLAAYLRDAAQRFEGDTLIVHAGDHVGASPLESALLQDEPSIQFLNLLGNRFCSPRRRLDPRCNLAGTPGNHEFDDGLAELLRLVRGGTARSGPFLETPYRGASFPYVSASVLRARDGSPVFPPFVIKRAGGVRLAVIGAQLEATPSMVVASGVRGVRFVPEAAAINRAVTAVRRAGVETIIVTIHQGIAQPPYEGPTRPDARLPEGEITRIVAQLHPAVDLVITGHAHAFSNALVPSRDGASVLVTQALSAGSAFARIELTIDTVTRDVVAKQASIIPTYADAGPGLTPAADVAALVERAQQRVATLSQRVVGTTPLALSHTPNAAGEAELGNLVADAQREALAADVALMNLGGIRTDLNAGDITYGELFAIQPFGNRLVRVNLSGAQLLRALEQQWRSTPSRMLQISGMSYVWDPQAPVGQRVVEARVGQSALSLHASYSVVLNNFLADGGGDFDVFREAGARSTGPADIDALVAYILRHGRPLHVTIDGRIRTR
jgi:5'-nucleotidase